MLLYHFTIDRPSQFPPLNLSDETVTVFEMSFKPVWTSPLSTIKVLLKITQTLRPEENIWVFNSASATPQAKNPQNICPHIGMSLHRKCFEKFILDQQQWTVLFHALQKFTAGISWLLKSNREKCKSQTNSVCSQPRYRSALSPGPSQDDDDQILVSIFGSNI